MELSNKSDLKRFLNSAGFTFKKSLGQNFLINPDVCPAMANAACAENGGVLEIGPGAGVLTAELAKRAKKVVAVEIDERLKPLLKKTLEPHPNAEVVFGDCMKMDLKKLIAEKFEGFETVTVCANLPYYITSPIVMMLLESRLPVDSVTVMVQKEAAQRLCAEVGTREAGAVTVAVKYYSEPEILFDVDRDSFLPPPNVDSAVIKLKVRSTPAVDVRNEKGFFSFVKACFAQRRKMLINSVSSSLSISKEEIAAALQEVGIDSNARAEKLTIEQLARLSDLLM